jgi:hypothetical protein
MQLMKKGCPRCQGDLSRVDDIGESYYSCVQCGHIMYQLPAAARVTRLGAPPEVIARPRAA